jgi:SNF2 family DNA or RNA helicase
MNFSLNTLLDIKLITETHTGSKIRTPAQIFITPARIEFRKSPFSLKDEIKAMKGSKWEGFNDPPRKIWSVENCTRNWFQLQAMMGLNPFEHFDRDLQHFEYDRPLMDHQKDMSDAGLTYHYQIWGAEMGTGKTLSAIEVMEKSGKKKWWWVAPRSGLYAVEREFKRWALAEGIEIEMMTYEGLVKRMGLWRAGDPAPQGVVFDESSRLKNAKAQRTVAAQALADAVRKEYSYEGYVLLMSGTPSPKSPVDWWSQAEIAWPGFLREGTADTFKFRLGIHHKAEGAMGNTFWDLLGWRDSTDRCNVCGELYDEGKHTYPGMVPCPGEPAHDFVACKNEVEYLYERLKGLVIVKHKKDCLDLPDKRYRIVECKPTASILRVAQSLVKTAPNTITGLTWLRELSDGFQYRAKVVGREVCPVCEGKTTTTYWVDPDDEERAFTMVDMLDPAYVQTLVQKELPCASCDATGEVDRLERIVREVPCPKEQALIELLEENDECGRMVVFAAFTGSVDKVTNLCLKQGWDVVQVDGRGWSVKKVDNTTTDEAPLDYWADLGKHPHVVFVANPKSGGMALTLIESRMIVYWSNSFDPESRSQSEDRCHRIGMDMNKGLTIVDLIHLPSDARVLEVLKDNRRLELMSLGAFTQGWEIEDGTSETTNS